MQRNRVVLFAALGLMASPSADEAIRREQERRAKATRDELVAQFGEQYVLHLEEFGVSSRDIRQAMITGTGNDVVFVVDELSTPHEAIRGIMEGGPLRRDELEIILNEPVSFRDYPRAMEFVGGPKKNREKGVPDNLRPKKDWKQNVGKHDRKAHRGKPLRITR